MLLQRGGPPEWYGNVRRQLLRAKGQAIPTRVLGLPDDYASAPVSQDTAKAVATAAWR